MIIQNSRRR